MSSFFFFLFAHCIFFAHRKKRHFYSKNQLYYDQKFQPVEALDMMNKKFANPYIIYYPVVSRDGMPFPVNRTVRDIQEEVNKGRRLREDQLWRGNIVAAKFADDHYAQMIDASMADFPILKNFLGTHASPIRVSSALPTPPHPPLPPPPPPPSSTITTLSSSTTTTTSSSSSSSPPQHLLPTPPPPHLTLPPLFPHASLSGGTRQIQFAESASSSTSSTSTTHQTYERE
jgi:hypothetical protein